MFTAIVVLMVAMVASTADAKERPKLKCAEDCSLDYKPVCGGPTGSTDSKQMKSFGNECVMRKHNCERSESKWLQIGKIVEFVIFLFCYIQFLITSLILF